MTIIEAGKLRWAKEAEKRGPEAPGGKICTVCKAWRPFSEYWPHSGGRFGLRPMCKACHRVKHAKWRKTPGAARHARHKIVRKYGLTREQYEEMVAAQGRRCAICRIVPKFTLVIDHDHGTGRVRGLLCRRCNIGIANLKESASVLRAAAEYVSKSDSAMDLRDIDNELAGLTFSDD